MDLRLTTSGSVEVKQTDGRADIGDVWWLPEPVAGYPGGKDRFCLIVALEGPNTSVNPGRVHYVVGSTRPCGRPVIVLETAEAELNQRTYFGFWWSGDISLPVLIGTGIFRGRLAPERRCEIRAAICAGKRIALKRLVAC
jgi:hypothetical protein